ncbi:SHOCT domain-containing protein [Streptomyces sp. NBC_01244]|uniref:SHOCT domain-containing protein n=1 Tax=Streptomyces sp. NBC_01244 TaxID=2903797 RepID=UPI002E11134D|nr:SHOCT domain-containing protein [Streptomyces sp. NBC_01244]
MDDYPLLNVFLTMMYFFLWMMWFFLLFKVITDIFRDHSLSGWAKTLWLILVIVLPYVGVFIYLIVRGRTMGSRDVEEAGEREAAFRKYVQEAAGSGSSHVDGLARLADLKNKGDISAEEYDQAKAKLLA